MELINATRMVAGYNMGLEPSGRELLVVVIKGTFRFPLPGESADAFALHEEQLPLVMADTFTGEPGFSAPVYESGFRAAQAALRRPAGAAARMRRKGGRRGGWMSGCGWGTGASRSRFAVRRHWHCGVGGVSASVAGAVREAADLLRRGVRRLRPAA